MNIIIVLLALYIAFLVANNELNKYIVNKVDDKIADYMEKNHIFLDVREELIMETLVTRFYQELISPPHLEYFPFLTIWQVLRNISILDEEIEDFIFFINSCYSDILTKEKKPEAPSTTTSKTHFVSYKLDGKIATILFTFDGGEVTIVDVTQNLKDKSESELYQDLLDALALINRGSKEFNHSYDLIESYQDALIIAQKEDKGRIRENKM